MKPLIWHSDQELLDELNRRHTPEGVVELPEDYEQPMRIVGSVVSTYAATYDGGVPKLLSREVKGDVGGIIF